MRYRGSVLLLLVKCSAPAHSVCIMTGHALPSAGAIQLVILHVYMSWRLKNEPSCILQLRALSPLEACGDVLFPVAHASNTKIVSHCE